MSVDKIVTRDVLGRLRNELGDKRIIFSSGVFDILHAGHVAYLERAKALGDILIIGVNSDSSVSANKGPKRPVVTEKDRIEVVAGLEAVDFAFLFEEENNRKNIEAIKPDVYVKAGDYTADKLGSKALVESYGGVVEILPFKDGRSTSMIIDTILTRYMDEIPRMESVSREPAPAVFLDRDGTINEHVEYLHEPEKFKEIPGAFEGIKRLKEAGFRVIVITNQPGIGFGYFTREDFFRVNKRMLKLAREKGAMIDGIYFSPYTEAEGSDCRKPGTLLVERAVREHSIELRRSYVIGDSSSDIEMAKRLGIPGLLVKTGEGGRDEKYEVVADYEVDSLKEAVEILLAMKSDVATKA